MRRGMRKVHGEERQQEDKSKQGEERVRVYKAIKGTGQNGERKGEARK